MTHRLTTNCAKNCCNPTHIVKVIVQNVVTCFFWDIVYIHEFAANAAITLFNLIVESGFSDRGLQDMLGRDCNVIK